MTRYSSPRDGLQAHSILHTWRWGIQLGCATGTGETFDALHAPRNAAAGTLLTRTRAADRVNADAMDTACAADSVCRSPVRRPKTARRHERRRRAFRTGGGGDQARSGTHSVACTPAGRVLRAEPSDVAFAMLDVVRRRARSAAAEHPTACTARRRERLGSDAPREPLRGGCAWDKCEHVPHVPDIPAHTGRSV
jgi:hypothetical protein